MLYDVAHIVRVACLWCLSHNCTGWQDDGFLKRTYKFGFCKELLHISALFERCQQIIQTNTESYNYFPPNRPAVYDSRPRRHK